MQKITSKIKKLIEENPLAFATVDKIGKPNVIGVTYVKVVSKNQILITDNYMRKTKENPARGWSPPAVPRHWWAGASGGKKITMFVLRSGINIGKVIN